MAPARRAELLTFDPVTDLSIVGGDDRTACMESWLFIKLACF